jgi:glycosyltransferase involved in cell wall biosynthesis
MSSNQSVLSLSSWFPTKENPLLGNFVLKHLKVISEVFPTTWLIIEGVMNDNFIPLETTFDGKLKIVRIQYRKSKYSFVNYGREKRILKDFLSKNNQFSHLIGNVIFPKSFLFLLAKKILKIELVIIEHSAIYQHSTYKEWNFKTNYLHKKAIQESKYIVSVSDFLKSEINSIFPNASIQVIPNVVDSVFYQVKRHPIENKIKLIHISNLDENYKNVFGIFRCLKRVVDKGVFDIELLVISDIVSKEHEDWVKLNNLENHIQFKGPLSSKEIAAEMSISNALVHFSTYETFSCVLAEAIACDLPIISTQVGILHSIDSPNITIVNDEESLFQALLDVRDKKKNFSSYNHEMKVQFTEHEIRLQFEKLLKSVI